MPCYDERHLDGTTHFNPQTHAPFHCSHHCTRHSTRAAVRRQATPLTAGSSALVREYYRQGYYPSAVRGASTAAGFAPYYNYAGLLGAVSGSVGPVTTAGVAQSFAYDLAGVDPACSGGPGTAPNSCGIHIHSGTSCSADAGAHYYVNPPITSDPWTSIGYASVGGMASGTVSGVSTGGGAADIVGRAVVVHDYGGARIACALLASDGFEPSGALLTA